MAIRAVVEMRDGARLVADISVPAGLESPTPAVVIRTPYARTLFDVEVAPVVAAGFAVVVQSVRGRHGSDGTFVPYFGEGDDGFDTIEWVAAQPWCNGNVGMMGASYGGWTQWAAARERPPHLRTLISSVCCALWTAEWPWRNGVLWPGAITWLHLVSGSDDYQPTTDELAHLDDSPTPLSTFQDRYRQRLPMADDWLRHPTPDDYWRPIDLQPQDFAAIDLPVLHITGWFDGCQLGSHFLYDGMRAHSPARDDQALVVGAWDHTVRDMRRSYDGLDFGDSAVLDYAGLRIRWFRRWLSGDAEAGAPRDANVFVTGRNEWLTLPAFPPAEPVERSWHLDGSGQLRPLAAAGDATLTFRYDPADPVPSRISGAPASYPQQVRTDIYARDDVVMFRSPPLESATAMVGVATAELWISSDAADTDWFVELADEAPDGTTILVALGMQRARFRDGWRQQLMRPGEVARVAVQLAPRAHEFKAGHHIVLAVTSSNAPLWAPNPNTGGDIYTEAEMRTAYNSVHVGPATPSRLVLQLMEG